MRTLFFAGLVAVATAVVISSFWKPVPIETRLVQLQLEQLLPEHADKLKDEPIELQAQFIDYARGTDPLLVAKATLALQRFPAMSKPIFALYGTQPAFQEILREYGEQVIPPIHYFLNHEVGSLVLRQRAGEWLDSGSAAVRRLWRDKNALEPAPTSPAEPKTTMSAADRGWYAVLFIEQEGHDFLGQFVRDQDGEVKWLQTERVLEGLNAFFAGGLRGLETKYRRDEPIALSDMGWAALDIAVGVSALKVLRAARAPATATRAMTYSQRSVALGSSLLRGSAIGLRLAKYGAPLALAYIAVRHPSMLNSLFGGMAEAFGVPAVLMQTLGWTMVLLPLALIFLFLLRPLSLVLLGGGSMLKKLDVLVRGRARSANA